MAKHVALYLRVSSRNQDTRSQEPDLKRWAAAQDQPTKWYTDKFTGKTMDRPGWRERPPAAVPARQLVQALPTRPLAARSVPAGRSPTDN